MQFPIILMFSILTSVTSIPLHSNHSVGEVNQSHGKIFQKLPLDDVVVTQDTLANQTVTSKLDCGRRCSHTEGCVMFTFLPGEDGPWAECQMYGQLASTTAGHQPSAGARSYRLKDSAKTCDGNYSQKCDRCLKFLKLPMAFANAKSFCHAQHGGRLVIARTSDDLTCVSNYAIANDGTKVNETMWMGADALGNPPTFKWQDGTALPRNSSLWADGEPTLHEKCTAIDIGVPALRGFECHRFASIMCQKDLV